MYRKLPFLTDKFVKLCSVVVISFVSRNSWYFSLEVQFLFFPRTQFITLSVELCPGASLIIFPYYSCMSLSWILMFIPYVKNMGLSLLKLKCRTQYEARVSHEGQRTASCRKIIFMELYTIGEKKHLDTWLYTHTQIFHITLIHKYFYWNH